MRFGVIADPKRNDKKRKVQNRHTRLPILLRWIFFPLYLVIGVTVRVYCAFVRFGGTQIIECVIPVLYSLILASFPRASAVSTGGRKLAQDLSPLLDIAFLKRRRSIRGRKIKVSFRCRTGLSGPWRQKGICRLTALGSVVGNIQKMNCQLPATLARLGDCGNWFFAPCKYWYRVPLKIQDEFLTMLITFSFSNQFLTVVWNCL